MLTEKIFDAGTVLINYAEGPPSGLPLVMLHGATLRWQDFLPVLPLFACRYHTYALDLRGFGRSGHTPGAYRIKDFAGDVVRFLHQCVAKPAALLGYSLGGAVAVQVAVEASDAVHAVILAEPAPYVFAEERVQQDLIFESFRALRALLETDPSLEDILALEMNSEKDSALRRAKAKALRQMDPDVLTNLVEHRFEEHFHPNELLLQIACPVLLLRGNPGLGGQVEDRDVTRALSLLRHCTHVHLPDTGHNLHRRQPIAFYQIVSNFLESL
jgi:pimeloyl-ACP methyl ester carboxylesterase